MTRLTLRAYLLFLSFELALSRRQFTTVHRRVRDRIVRCSPANCDCAQACRAINVACALYFKEVQCLQRSAALVCLLRDLGVSATLVIGAQRLPFKAHAWAEVDGRVVNDSESSVELYGVLDRF
jgi:hypothetical protein